MNKNYQKHDRTFWIGLVLVSVPYSALQTWMLSQPQANPFDDRVAARDSTAFFTMAMVMLIGGVPFGLLLPGIKGSFFGLQSGLPKGSYAFPRTILKPLCSVVYGSSVGSLLAMPLVPIYVLPYVISTALTATALGFATRRRFRRSPATEWVAPNPWYRVFRPVIRGARPDR